jgi:TonB family protein
MRYIIICLFCILPPVMSEGQEANRSEQIPKVSSKTMAALLLTATTPDFPKTPMKKCSNAMVTLDVIISADGTVATVKVLSGFEEFRESAVSAVKQWRYRPYIMDGVATSVETSVLVYYPSGGTPGSLFVPDGKGGVKGGNSLLSSPDCGPISVKPDPPPHQ